MFFFLLEPGSTYSSFPKSRVVSRKLIIVTKADDIEEYKAKSVFIASWRICGESTVVGRDLIAFLRVFAEKGKESQDKKYSCGEKDIGVGDTNTRDAPVEW